jgi:glycosyltransferase involved in cell wall biosynthesis
MRILHTTHSANPKSGGPIEGIKQLAVANGALGHEIELVTLDAPTAPWLKEMPIATHALGPGMLKYGFSPRFEPWLRAHRHRFDIVIVNGIWQYSSFGTWRALRRSTPYCVFTHGMLDPWFQRHYPLKHIKKLCYWAVAERLVLRDAAAVLFTSEEERRCARISFPHYQCHERVVGYGTKGPVGDAVRQRQRFIEVHPHLEGQRLLLFLGRIHEKKGCDLLLTAFGALLRQNQSGEPLSLEGVHLVMAGPNEHPYARHLAAHCEQLGIADQVTWTGMLAGEQKWGAMHAADAFILPSHQENFGIAVAEALACGVPVLISNKVNIWREIESARAGLIEDDTLEGTTGLLTRWLQKSPASWDEMKKNARNCFNERFNVESAAASLMSTLQSLLEGEKAKTGKG